MHVRHGQVASSGGARAVADQDWPVFGLSGGHAVAALHEGRVERYHVKQGAEAELLLDEPSDGPAFGPEQRGIEEEFAWVVTRLAMDVHRAGEVGRQPIIEPVGISKPGVGLERTTSSPARG